MKIILSICLVILNVFSGIKIEMAEPDPAGLVIYIDNCVATESILGGFEMPGHIDLLIEKSSYLGTINDQINDRFMATYPNYESFDFIESETFVSYFAFAENPSANTKYDSLNQWGRCYYSFARFSTHELGQIKLVYFDDSGTILFQSDVMTVLQPNPYQVGYTSLSFNPDTLLLTNHIRVETNPMMILLLAIVFVISIFYLFFLISLRFIGAWLLQMDLKLSMKSFLLTCLLVFGYSLIYVFAFHELMMGWASDSLVTYYVMMNAYLVFDVVVSIFVLKPKKIVLYILLNVVISIPLMILFSHFILQLTV